MTGFDQSGTSKSSEAVELYATRSLETYAGPEIAAAAEGCETSKIEVV